MTRGRRWRGWVTRRDGGDEGGGGSGDDGGGTHLTFGVTKLVIVKFCYILVIISVFDIKSNLFLKFIHI